MPVQPGLVVAVIDPKSARRRDRARAGRSWRCRSHRTPSRRAPPRSPRASSSGSVVGMVCALADFVRAAGQQRDAFGAAQLEAGDQGGGFGLHGGCATPFAAEKTVCADPLCVAFPKREVSRRPSTGPCTSTLANARAVPRRHIWTSPNERRCTRFDDPADPPSGGVVPSFRTQPQPCDRWRPIARQCARRDRRRTRVRLLRMGFDPVLKNWERSGGGTAQASDVSEETLRGAGGRRDRAGLSIWLAGLRDAQRLSRSRAGRGFRRWPLPAGGDGQAAADAPTSNALDSDTQQDWRMLRQKHFDRCMMHALALASCRRLHFEGVAEAMEESAALHILEQARHAAHDLCAALLHARQKSAAD